MISPLILSVLAISAVKIIAQYLFQLSIHKPNAVYLWTGIGCYAVMGYLVYIILKDTGSLASANIIASNVSGVIIITMGWIVFNQTLKPIQFAGILTVLIGSYMVSKN
jgi:drug/metabolite transporter (DMT)-like permease